MPRNTTMRLLVTRAGVPNGKRFNANSLSVFLNVVMKECYFHVYCGFYMDGNLYVLIDQQMYNYAPGVWILRNPTRISRPTLAKKKIQMATLNKKNFCK